MKYPPLPSLNEIYCPTPCQYCATHFDELTEHDWHRLTGDQRCRLLMGHARALNGGNQR